MRSQSLLICTLTVLCSVFAQAADTAARRFLCCDYNANQVCIVAADGSIEWRYEAKNPQDCWQLPNGNILFCHLNGVKEVTRKNEVVWEYNAPEKVECHAAQPLPDGRVLLTECGTSRMLELEKGKVVKEVKLITKTTNAHNQFRGTRKLANGNYIVCFKGDNKVVELDGEGKVVREIPVAGDPHEVVALKDGVLLITCGDGHKVFEIDPAGKVLWEINENDLPENPLRLMAGCQRLPNGNTVFCNYLGHGHIGKQPQFFEVTREKKVVWSFADHAHFKSINQVQMLDIPGDVTKGEITR